jgi:hypothetical protein
MFVFHKCSRKRGKQELFKFLPWMKKKDCTKSKIKSKKKTFSRRKKNKNADKIKLKKQNLNVAIFGMFVLLCAEPCAVYLFCCAHRSRLIIISWYRKKVKVYKLVVFVIVSAGINAQNWSMILRFCRKKN